MTTSPPSPDGSVSVTYKGTEFLLVFDMEAIAFFERAADVSIAEALDGLQLAFAAGRAPKLSHLAFLVQAGLHRHHPEINLNEAARMSGDPAVFRALNGGVREAMPADRGKAGIGSGNGSARARKRGTGTSSSAKPSKRKSRSRNSGA